MANLEAVGRVQLRVAAIRGQATLCVRNSYDAVAAQADTIRLDMSKLALQQSSISETHRNVYI